MKLLLLTACWVVLFINARAQTITFDASIPANWSTTGVTPLSLSAEHYKGGTSSLKWQAAAGDTLQAINLGIAASAISSSGHWYIYSAAVTNDTLIIQFLDAGHVVKREGHMLLNYKGWREYHRNLKDDYNYGSSLPLFAPDQFRMIYKPAAASSGTIYIDEVDFTGYGQARIPGTHMLLDYQHFAKNAEDAPAGNGLASWLNTPDIAATAPTGPETTGLGVVKGFYPRPLPAIADTNELKGAKNYVTACNISRNADSSIKGRPLDSLTQYYPQYLLQLSNYCGLLARAWKNNNDADALNKLRLFTEYLLDQGLAEGGRIVLLTNDYKYMPGFPIGFLQALADTAYTPALRDEVTKMLKWSLEYNKIYATSITPGLNLDYLYKKSPYLFELACLDTSSSRAVRDLKSISRFLEQNTYTSQGGRDGIKPDGTGFHHQVHYLEYTHAFRVWTAGAFSLKGTPFKVSATAYSNMSNAVKTVFLEINNGHLYANSECGRVPFQTSVPLEDTVVRNLVYVGGDVLGTTIDTSLAAAYNYFFNSTLFSAPATNLDGFYQFNYAQLGVLRKSNWMVAMKGFTNKLFGAEIYPAQNRYGRYQSYGAVEVLYSGSISQTGYSENGWGWDWNVVPGATTVHLTPYSSLNYIADNAEEHQLGSFAGALSLGKDGLWGFDFKQDTISANYATSNLAFHKSVFAFDTILVCLGSGIKTSNSLGNVATNLFQGTVKLTSDNPTIYINTSAGTTADLNTTVTPGKYIFTAQKTYYYIPTGNDSITIFRGTQISPRDTSPSGNTVDTNKVSKAWLTHGTHPTNAGYQYVIVPNVVKTQLTTLTTALTGGTKYAVLKKTDTLHAVKYYPNNVTGYVFFQPATNVNIGYVKSISGKALVGVRESGDTIRVNIACPDLNTTDDSTSYWVSSPASVTLTLSGNWAVLTNASGATITQNTDSLAAGFSLQHGAAAYLVLVKQSGSRRATNDSLLTTKPAADKMAAALTLIPNPAGKYMNMVYASPVAEKVEVSITTVSGQVLVKQQQVVSMGINTMQAPVATLAAGVYTLTIKGSSGVQNRRFIKY
jgi:hypothetical protein